MGFFSNIFKKIKKAIKKPLSKIFKGVGKGIARVAKNVWKGIKGLGTKAVQAYGKFSQKLGPIGMIGLSIAMPYFLGAFSGAGGGLWTGFGKMMGTSVTGPGGQILKTGLSHSQNPFLSIIGRAGKGMYNAGNFIGGTAKGITQTIGETFKGFASEGTFKSKISSGFNNLYRGTSEVLTGKAGMGTSDLARYSQSQIQQAVRGSKYLTQTGGVNLGNANIQNSFYRDVMAETMKGQVSMLDGNAKKYFNATKNYFPGIDDKAAFEYVQNNGVFKNNIAGKDVFSLDFSQSADFKFTAPVDPIPGPTIAADYNFTGENINNTLKKFKVNTDLGYSGKIAKDSYKMPGEDTGGILSKKNITNAALETAKNWFASDSDQQGLIQGTDPNLVVRGTKYLGTDIKGSAGGDLLAAINPELAEQIKRTQQFNIQAG